MLSDACDDDGSTLSGGFLGDELGHQFAVAVVEMAHGLVGQKEVEGLRQRTNQGDALLLSERHHTDLLAAFLADFQAIKPLVDLVVGGEIRQSVLDLHVFQRREFGEEAKFLKQTADVLLAQLRPVLRREIGRFSVVEKQFAREIVAIADEIAAKRAFSHTAVGLDEVFFAFFERQVLSPDLRLQIGMGGEHLRNDISQSDCVHFLRFYEVNNGVEVAKKRLKLLFQHHREDAAALLQIHDDSEAISLDFFDDSLRNRLPDGFKRRGGGIGCVATEKLLRRGRFLIIFRAADQTEIILRLAVGITIGVFSQIFDFSTLRC